MKKMFAAKEGFTLVELIVVIAILGILAAVAVPAYSGYISKAHESSDIVALDAIKTATLAACAEEGEVTAISITATVTNGKATIT
ncbi:MAG: prepilin-type N-terminal cleavage/methylation domain-containing protein, partial [Oscillibacter sp.]|nr:prepilin-type N-terminal cleavage/methylation domain-containing protein [Oscillibacter sp.]